MTPLIHPPHAPQIGTKRLILKPEKCDFEQKEIDYLGVIVGNGRIQMDLKKLKGVADWPVPRNPTEIRKFLGFTGYY